jgi:preprotein translocase subunit SecG
VLTFFLGFLLVVTALFLILLVLVQRGRGGGLAGAFGGLGGQSAFGTKAGDVFTRITIGVAFFWIVLCVASVKLLSGSASPISPDLGKEARPEASVVPDPADRGAGGGLVPGREAAGGTATKPAESANGGS